MVEKTSKNIVAFGKTRDELISLADERTEQKDNNHPTNSGTYADFVKTAMTGREKLNKSNYCKKKK